MNEQNDIVVVGGGMIGSCAALGLAQQGHSVTVVEPHCPHPIDLTSPPDCRVSAVSVTSIALLQSLGVWPAIQKLRSQSYRQMSVWEKRWSRVDLTASSIALNELGHMVENQVLQWALFDACSQHENIKWQSSGVKGLKGKHVKSVILSDDTELSAPVIVGADGGNSRVRQGLNIGTTGWGYSQKVLGVVIEHHGTMKSDCTWQQFTATGPQAYLPLYDHFGCLIWYHNNDQVNQLSRMTNNELKLAICQHFPIDNHDFNVVSSASFPIFRHHAHRYWQNNGLLLGDAAHSINPLAGQGLNLGFLDVKALLALTADGLTPEKVQSIGCQYERARRQHNQTVMNAMDIFHSSFSNNSRPLALLRNVALSVAKIPPLQQLTLKYALGLTVLK